jgi:hypothetical protein
MATQTDPQRPKQARYCERPGCTNHLVGKQKRYCSNSCRATASHMARTADARALAESIALESIREKIEPVTRELLTDDVLRELKNLVELLPMAVAELERELAVDAEGHPLVEDPDVRHKAALQVLKMTVGNPSIAPANAEQQPAALTVVIGQSMESKVPARTSTVEVDGEVLELRECHECHISKPPDQFVGNSDRCSTCHDKLVAAASERFGADLVRSVHASG